MAHLVCLLIFVALAAASWGVAVAVYRSTVGGPDPAAAPHYRLVRAAAVGAVAVTSFMPFYLGYSFGVLYWFSAANCWSPRCAAFWNNRVPIFLPPSPEN